MPSFMTSQIILAGVPERSDLKKKLAARFGVLPATVGAWASGAKRNPLDQTERYIEFIHPHDPGNARLAANHFTELVNRLDFALGVRDAMSGDGICQSLRRKVKESADVVALLVGSAVNGYDAEEIRAGLTEIAQDRAALDALEGCLREQLARIEKSEPAVTGSSTSGQEALRNEPSVRSQSVYRV